MRFITSLFVCAAIALSGCAASSNQDSSEPTAQTDDALSTSQKGARTAIQKAVQHWGQVDKKVVTVLPRTAASLPAKVATKFDQHLADEEWDDKLIYAVYKDSSKHTLIGYAVGLAWDNGDGGGSLVMGFDPSGTTLFSTHTGWAED
jgi:hypothetical protein